MDYETISWIQLNWVFVLASASLISMFMYWKKEDTHIVIIVLVLIYFVPWVVWRLASNNILNQWGLSALDAWNFGEIEHDGIPNIELTILGWIMYVVLVFAIWANPEPEETEKKLEKKEVQKRSTKKAAAEESLKANEKKVDDLFDDI